MKDINELSNDLNKYYDKLVKRLAIVQQESAKNMFDDVRTLAPSKAGDYFSSIQLGQTNVAGNTISTKVFTDLTSNDGYAIGRMIENGTGIYALEPHIGHTKTFKESGYQFWYVPAKSVKRPVGKKIIINGTEFYIAKAQPAKPHFKPALDMNRTKYKQNIAKAIKEIKL